MNDNIIKCKNVKSDEIREIFQKEISKGNPLTFVQSTDLMQKNLNLLEVILTEVDKMPATEFQAFCKGIKATYYAEKGKVYGKCQM